MTWRLSYFLFKKFKLSISHLYDHPIIDDGRFLNLVYRLKREGRTLQSLWELYNVYRGVLMTAQIPGDIVEVGVFKGGSAKLICEIKGEKHLHLFDTFEGMPRAGEDDIIQEGAFSDTAVDNVRQYLEDYNNVFFYKGLFPKTAAAIKNRKISFLHLDVDIYTSTSEALHFFYSRMSKGGLIISHDYNSKSCPGVKKACDEFFKDKPEPIVELSSTTQCLVPKM